MSEALIADAAKLAQTTLSSVKTAIDSTISQTAAEVPTLTGDAVTFAEDYLENHVGGTAGSFLKMALGIAVPAAESAVAPLSTALVAALHVAQLRVDNDLSALSAKV